MLIKVSDQYPPYDSRLGYSNQGIPTLLVAVHSVAEWRRFLVVADRDHNRARVCHLCHDVFATPTGCIIRSSSSTTHGANIRSIWRHWNQFIDYRVRNVNKLFPIHFVAESSARTSSCVLTNSTCGCSASRRAQACDSRIGAHRSTRRPCMIAQFTSIRVPLCSFISTTRLTSESPAMSTLRAGKVVFVGGCIGGN